MKQSLLLLILIATCITGFSQDNNEAIEAAKKAQNPLSNIITLPLQNNSKSRKST